MMELVDIPGWSIHISISRLWAFHPKQAIGGFRGPFCAPKLGVPKIWVGEHFCMAANPLRKRITGGVCPFCPNYAMYCHLLPPGTRCQLSPDFNGCCDVVDSKWSILDSNYSWIGYISIVDSAYVSIFTVAVQFQTQCQFWISHQRGSFQLFCKMSK